MRKRAIIFLAVTIVFSSGCRTIRAKFVRERHPAGEEPPVYASFKDYPAQPTKEAYIDYYDFLKGWIDDLAEALQEGTNLKREKRAIEQALMNMEQMMYYYNEEGKAKAAPLYKELQEIKDAVYKDPNQSDFQRNALLNRTADFKRRLQREFYYDKAQVWFAAQ